jgi:hypothetical protein
MSSDEPKPSALLQPPNPGVLEIATLFWDPRLFRKYWLEAWSQATDGYLRSTAFLELMQQGLQTLIEAKSAPRATLTEDVVLGDSRR